MLFISITIHLLLISVYGKDNEKIFKDKKTLELMRSERILDYFTHFIIRQFENLDYPRDDPLRFRIEILFCPGYVNSFEMFDLKKHKRPLKNYILINDQLGLADWLNFIESNQHLSSGQANVNISIGE